eukprot:jgi/Ulvmu1/9565/UM053_0054.1
MPGLGSNFRISLACLPVLLYACANAPGMRSVATNFDRAGEARPDRASISESSPEAEQQRTIMQCLGTDTLTRACHFEHVYYDLVSTRFVFYGAQGATPDVFGDPPSPGNPWLRLIRRGIGWERGMAECDRQFHMEWRPGERLPPPQQVAGFKTPLHLRAPFHTKSISHLLRDNLQFLVDLPLRFGRDPTAFDWVRWEAAAQWTEWEDESETEKHYRGLFNNRPSVTWQQVIEQAMDGVDKSKVKYIRFAEIIAGQGPADIVSQVGSLELPVTSGRMAAWAHMCGPFPFTAMRDVAYRNHGLKVTAAPELKPFVLFLDGQKRERRHLTNAARLLPKLKKAFPGVRMEHVMISRHPLKRQLELLSKATVLVSNIGSRSFRLIYLPNGATTILVGPPEYTFQLVPPQPGDLYNPYHPIVDKVTPYTITKPFIEIDWCWGYIGYVNMLRYHVSSAAEVHKTQKWFTWTDARNTDIVLDEAKITDLLRIALQRTKHSTAQHGSGTLSAFAA